MTHKTQNRIRVFQAIKKKSLKGNQITLIVFLTNGGMGREVKTLRKAC